MYVYFKDVSWEEKKKSPKKQFSAVKTTDGRSQWAAFISAAVAFSRADLKNGTIKQKNVNDIRWYVGKSTAMLHL